MQLKYGIFFVLVTLGMLLAAGCMAPSPPPETPGTTVTVPPAATTVPPVALPAIRNITRTVTPLPAAVTDTPTVPEAANPILHRWIRMLPDADANGHYQGYELKFLIDGTVEYRSGSVTEVYGNLRIDPVESESTGTWTGRGDHKYLVKVWPVAGTGAQFIREYTYVPQYVETTYKITQREHIESPYERDAVPTYGNRATLGRFLYPERAKVD